MSGTVRRQFLHQRHHWLYRAPLGGNDARLDSDKPEGLWRKTGMRYCLRVNVTSRSCVLEREKSNRTRAILTNVTRTWTACSDKNKLVRTSYMICIQTKRFLKDATEEDA